MVPPGAIKNKKKRCESGKNGIWKKIWYEMLSGLSSLLWEKQLYFTMFSVFVLSEHTTVTELHPLIRLEKLFIMRKQKLKQ